MCGIVGYVGEKQAQPILLEGLKRLEYRGYDSCGMACSTLEGKIDCIKAISDGGIFPIEVLRTKLEKNPGPKCRTGIAHTRWATHGKVTYKNAHPHLSCNKEIAVVHNGMVENDMILRDFLKKQSHDFISDDSDTEVIPHLIEEAMKNGMSFEEAFLYALGNIRGDYALAAICAQEPTTILAARLGRPLLIESCKTGHFLGSDPAVLVGRTKEAICLQDGQVARLQPDKFVITNLNGKPTRKVMVTIPEYVEEAQKGYWPFFMAKEIAEQPLIVRTICAERLNVADQSIRFKELHKAKDQLKRAKRLILVGCGTSLNAALVGKYLLQKKANVPTEVEFACEFPFQGKPFEADTVVVLISQSGETADTIAAFHEAKKKGFPTYSVVNVVGSTLSRETEASIHLHAGPEIGVASTKAFLAQVVVLSLLPEWFRQLRGDIPDLGFMQEMEAIPEKIEKVLSQSGQIEALAQKYCQMSRFFFLGSEYLYPIAREGALKLEEIARVSAKGFPGGEIKHGPLGAVDDKSLTIGLVPEGNSTPIRQNLAQVKARGGQVLIIGMEGDDTIQELAHDVFCVPRTLREFSPLIMVVPLQLLAYHICVLLGHNPDKPRNLAKSVTVR